MTAKATRRILRFENAVRKHELMGLYRPEGHAEILRNYRHSKESLRSYIGSLEAAVARFAKYREDHP